MSDILISNKFISNSFITNRLVTNDYFFCIFALTSHNKETIWKTLLYSAKLPKEHISQTEWRTANVLLPISLMASILSLFLHVDGARLLLSRKL